MTYMTCSEGLAFRSANVSVEELLSWLYWVFLLFENEESNHLRRIRLFKLSP